jgi:hypothetical protein
MALLGERCERINIFVLRVYQHQTLKRIETEHRVVKWVAEKGISDDWARLRPRVLEIR